MLRDDDQPVSAPPAAAYLLAAISCAILPARHRAPGTAVAVTVGCAALVPPFGLFLNPLVLAPVMIAAFSLEAGSERRGHNATMATSALLLATSLLVFDIDSWQAATRTGVVAFPLLAGALGRSLRDRRAYLAAVEDRARRAEESRESEARRRVAEERMRIARELHDIVAHHIALANAQAAVATQVFDSHPERSRASLRQLSETTADALHELRATVGLLRQSGGSSTPLEPAPGLSRLPALVESFRRTGLDVTVRQTGPARPLSPGADLTAYRIVQEALTNVTKHAAIDRAQVNLTYDDARLTIAIADDGRSPAAPADRAPGYGLIGMRERAAAAGGRLTVGRRPQGGFLVTLELPLAPPRDAARLDLGEDGQSGDGHASGPDAKTDKGTGS
ncbi:sensor histidine kinase [Frankia canadensis]|nr:sensor histidine kinase [Frankia canadensis]